MKNAPLVSVILPVFNAEKYLSGAVQSILNQSYSKFELIIIDDGSTDHSVAIAQSFEDARIKIIRNPANFGISKSLNTGIRQASGTFIARMDADDISLPKRLEKQVAYLQKKPEVDLVGSWALIQREGVMGVFDQFRKTVVGKIPQDIPIHVYTMFTCPLIHATILGKKKLFIENPYNVECTSSEDYELFSRLAFQYRIEVVKEPLYIYFQRRKGNSRANANDHQTEVFRIFSNNWATDAVDGLYKLSRDFDKPIYRQEAADIERELHRKLDHLISIKKIDIKDRHFYQGHIEAILRQKRSFPFVFRYMIKRFLLH